MSGHVYGILFNNGLFKVGKTAKPLGRIKQHIGAGKSFGYKLEIFFLTECHETYSETEQRLISYCSDRFQSTTPEYFCGVTIQEAREVMIRTGLLVTWGDKISASSGSIMITMRPTEGAKASFNEDLYYKVRNLISRNPNGITEGVIKNRFRTKDISEVLSELESAGMVKIEERFHKCMKTTARVFYPF